MEDTMEPLVVGVRFSKVGKIYHFVADTVVDIKVGDQVVVETTRGWQLGQVAQIIPNPEPPPEGWKPIDRRATPRDLLLRQMWQMKESEVVGNCRARSVELNLSGIKIVSAEYSFDGSRLTIFFSSETEEKYDLKSLRSDMQKFYGPSQVEMRQIGPRDVAKTVCGMGACGLETRCCCLFLTEFSSISIRMAKEQGISLTPTEITGMCGRLRCCLIYEYDNYVDARAKLPKRNKRVLTPQGEGKVVDVIPLRGAVVVDLPEVGYREFPGTDVQIIDANGEVQPKPQPEPPFHGTEQASVMDQAITGDTTEKPFTISADNPPPASPWENPPAQEQPRSMPRTDRPSRPNTQRRPNAGQGQDSSRPGGQRPGGGQRSGGPRPGGKDQGPSAEAGQPGQETRPGGAPENRPQGSRPQGNRPRSGQGPRREGRPNPPRGQVDPGSSNPGETPAGGQPRQPGNQPGGGAPRSSNREQRRRRGPRRDNNDTENRT